MSDITLNHGVAVTPIPAAQLFPWALFGGLLMLLALYFVSTEEGAAQLLSGLEAQFLQAFLRLGVMHRRAHTAQRGPAQRATGGGRPGSATCIVSTAWERKPERDASR